MLDKVRDDAAQDFAERQARNRWLSAGIVVGFVLFFILVGFAVDYLYLDAFTASGPAFPIATAFSLLVAGGTSMGAYYRGDRYILRSLGAEDLDIQIAEHRELYNIVTEMALASGCPMPKIYVIFDPSPNAFATGRNESAASVCVTTGLLALLSREETQGVIAHEISHIRNQDILVMTLVSILLGGVALLSDWARRSFYSARHHRRTRVKSLLLILPALLLIGFSPLISRLLAMAVSRQREYLADATATEYTRNPLGLAKALEKIRDASMPFHKATRGTAHLFFVNPLRWRIDDREGRLADLLSTHPPIARRIMLLYRMAGLREAGPVSPWDRDAMARCPVCQSAMSEVSVRANPGQLIIVDQCRECGGIWCDKWELFPIDPNEARRLDPLDEKLLRAPVRLAKTLHCPRCRDRLLAFKEPLLPPEIQLQRCRRCEGIWLNRGQFRLYKNFQSRTRRKNLGKKETVQKVAAACQDPKSWVVTGTRGIFAYPRSDVEGDDLVENTISGAFRLILQTLLRMVLRF